MLHAISSACSMALMLFRICVSHPDNLQACMTNHDEWLWPEIERAWDLYTGEELPYQEESVKLEG